MSVDDRNGSWFTEQQAILVLTLLSVLLATFVILPYLEYVLFGMILAYILWPLQQWFTEYIRRDVSAFLLTLVAVIAIPIPFLYLVRELSQQAFAVIEMIEEADIDIAEVEATLLSWGIEVDLQEAFEENQEVLTDALELIAWRIVDVVQGLPGIFIGLTITVFVLFVLLRDGLRLSMWIHTMLPIRDEIQDDINDRLNRLMRASVIGNVVAGLIQAVLLGIGFWLLGFNNVLFLTVLTFVLALLPLVGAFIVWVPLVGYLVAISSTGLAAILFVYGSLVSISDFYTRPIVIGHSAELNSAVIVVGVFGGLVAFGPIGLLIGPVLIGGAKIAIEAMIRARNEDTRPTEAS